MDTEDHKSQAGAQSETEDKKTAASEVNTGGGVHAAGNVETGGGKFIGRDEVGGSVYHVSGSQVIIQAGHEPVLTYEDPNAAPAPGESPYKGLQFFDVADTDLFFGREQLTAALVGRLRQQRFLAVVGASGSGKSSLVRAGLVPALTKEEPLADGTTPPNGYQAQHVHIITPTALPLESLASSLTRESESVTAVTTLVDNLAKDPRSLRVYVRRLLEGSASTARLLLVIDQFEEVFTLCRDKAQRQALVDNLLTAASEESQVVVVITLRADFYAQCAEFDNLRAALATYQEYIGPMKPDELRRAIEEPTHLGGWQFEPGLVEQLLDDVGQEPGALPLLAHALLETWKRRRGYTLTLGGYRASGQVKGAIAVTANQVYSSLNEEKRLIARHIFLRLTELGEGTQDTRRRVGLDELLSQATNERAAEEVLHTLADARLITTDQKETEVAHEALIREWPTLRQWLNENREWLRLHRRLTEAAQEWEKMAQAQDMLYRRTTLEQTQEKAKGHEHELNQLENTFLKASWAAIASTEREQEMARQRELAQARTLANRQRSLLVAVTASLVLALSAGWYIYTQNKQLEIEKQHAITAQQTAEANAHLATQQLAQLDGERLRKQASEQKAVGDVNGALASLQAATKADPNLKLDWAKEEADVRRQAATLLVQAGEQLAAQGNHKGASGKFQQAFELKPPPDTLLYVWIPPGKFTIGASDDDSLTREDEKPQQTVEVAGFWIMRTEVTNAQYKHCVETKICMEPSDSRWDKEPSARQPVTAVPWAQARLYAGWVGGRLPTEVEWEKACRGTDGRRYPWGNEAPASARLNYLGSGLGTWSEVGKYPPGANGLYDMAGNVWEWTSSMYKPYPYQANDGREDPSPGDPRTFRGGSWADSDSLMRCAARYHIEPYGWHNRVGFRVVSPGF